MYGFRVAHHFYQEEITLPELLSAGLQSKPPTANQCTGDQSKHCPLERVGPGGAVGGGLLLHHPALAVIDPLASTSKAVHLCVCLAFTALGQWAYHCQLQGTIQQVLQMAHVALGLGRAALLETGLPVGQFQEPPESSTGLLGLQRSQTFEFGFPKLIWMDVDVTAVLRTVLM